MPHSTFNIGKLFPYKDRQSLLHSVGVVYQLTRSCDQKYIGQTKRNLITRVAITILILSGCIVTS